MNDDAEFERPTWVMPLGVLALFGGMFYGLVKLDIAGIFFGAAPGSFLLALYHPWPEEREPLEAPVFPQRRNWRWRPRRETEWSRAFVHAAITTAIILGIGIALDWAALRLHMGPDVDA